MYLSTIFFASENDAPFYKESGLQCGSALEIGVGSAGVASELEKTGIGVWGIDSTPNMLKNACARGKKTVKRSESSAETR